MNKIQPRPPKRIGIASDHAGFDMKLEMVKILKQTGYEVIDFGPLVWCMTLFLHVRGWKTTI